jgi:hypothetical protein
MLSKSKHIDKAKAATPLLHIKSHILSLLEKAFVGGNLFQESET